MPLISTKQLFEEVYSQELLESVRKNRKQVDRPELYAYERKIGKELVEMDSDEIDEMISTFVVNKTTNRGISVSTTKTVITELRKAIDYYSKNYKAVWNPLREDKYRGLMVEMTHAKNNGVLTKERVDKVIYQIHENLSPKRANYTECLILLFLNGFQSPGEIANLKKENIDFRNKTVVLPGRRLKLSDRCFELLNYVHNLEIIDDEHRKYSVESWNGSYFKFIVTSRGTPLNQRDFKAVCTMISTILMQNVAGAYDPMINYERLFNLGFYLYVVEKYGKEQAKDIILSVRDNDSIEKIQIAAIEYGVSVANTTNIKRRIVQYVENDTALAT